jgi:ribA/ribD-fused uncharacterized protein
MIESFRGKNYFLSNFYYSPINFDGLRFKSVEAAFQAAKTTDLAIKKSMQSLNPVQAKKLGRRLQLRPDWHEVKEEVMLDLLRIKFAPGSELASCLLGTGDQLLVEGNSWGDTFWGVCRGQGANKLGLLLMQVRSELL